jgi:hypothetical protein
VGNIGFGRYWFGVLPLHVGYLFKTGYYKEPEASLTRDFPFEYMKRSKNISGDERRLQSDQSKFAPSGWKIKTFSRREEVWLEEGLLVLAKKNKREGLQEKVLPWPRRRCTTKLCATIRRNSGAAELLR